MLRFVNTYVTYIRIVLVTWIKEIFVKCLTPNTVIIYFCILVYIELLSAAYCKYIILANTYRCARMIFIKLMVYSNMHQQDQYDNDKFYK